MSHALALALALAALVPTEPTAPPAERFDALHLDVSVGSDLGLEAADAPGKQLVARWRGDFEGSAIQVDLIQLPSAEGGFREAGGVTDAIVGWLRQTADFDVESMRTFEGEYGWSPILAVATAPTGEGASQYVLGGLTEEYGYAFHVHCDPRPSERDEKKLYRAFEKGLEYDGPERDPEWTREEVEARWLRDAPEELHEDFLEKLSRPRWRKDAVTRTDHYIILTNSSGGEHFGEKMEENFEEIIDVFPFEEVDGRRLMPVFLFRTAEEYYAYYSKVAGVSRGGAARSKGHAWKDYYATWYESPVDPVHIHEQTHQIFTNRLLLRGGGSWYQEGVAEYIETSDNERNVVARLVEKGRHMPLVEFFQLPSLLHSSSESRVTGGSEAADLYKQAALFVEFLRESKWGKGKFERYLYTLGYVPRGDIDKIRAGFMEVYGATIEEIDEAFQEYCEKR